MIKHKQRLKAKGKVPNEKDWKRKTPYDFTGCLAHIDLTFRPAKNYEVLRITGILEHNEMCEKQRMKRLPAIPLHNHVWQIALEQLNAGARYACVSNLCNIYFHLTLLLM